MPHIFHRPKALPQVTLLPFLLTLVLFSPLAGGCGRSPQEHANFAKAGTTYAEALDNLLEASANISIDAHSAELLQKRSLATVPDEMVKQFSEQDKDRLETIGRLRRHARLLGKYFTLLNDLATSDAPDRAGDAMAGTVKALSGVGDQLRNPTLTRLAGDQEKFKVTTNFVVTGIVRGRLNSELKARQETIRKELKTQEELLKALSEDLGHNMDVLTNIREDLFVNAPLKVGVPEDKREEWMARRRSILLAPRTTKELTAAGEAVGNLREVFENLLQGKLNRERFDLVLADFSSLLSVAETLKKSSGGS